MAFNYGGWAGLRSVNFHSDDYTVHAIQTKDGIKVEYEDHVEAGSVLALLDDYLSRIPFIRGIWLAVYSALKKWKMLLLLVPILTVVMLLMIEYTGADAVIESRAFDYLNFLVSLLLITIMIKFSDIGKYHAAEHMTSNAFDSSGSIDLADIRVQSRIHKSCGTNLVVYDLFCAFILLIFVHDFSLAVWSGISIGYEIFMLKDGHLRKFLFPLYWIGRGCQYLFFTASPDEDHLKVGQAAFRKLLELENNKDHDE